MEEGLWKQGSRDLWMIDWDRNIACFYHKASTRQNCNDIGSVYIDLGVQYTSEVNIETVVINYFDTLFSSSTLSNLQYPINYIDSYLKPKDVASLLALYNESKVLTALK